jgi:hypothetical protein
MNKHMLRVFTSMRFSFALAISIVMLVTTQASAQCPVSELTSGLQLPLGITQSNQGNLLVSESGTRTPNTGRISIVDLLGNRRTLLAGMPSGINDVGDASGPAGVFIHGRTLYVAIGVGDVGRPGPLPGTTVPNPNPISSPIFSSVLAIHFSARVERTTGGFMLSLANQQALAGGQEVTLSNGSSDRITIELIANFPDYTPNPLPFFPPNIRLSNPFDLVAVGHHIYVTDGGQNSARKIDIPTGAFTTLAAFPNVPNPFFGTIGGPTVEAVPTGIRYSDGQLLVTLFRGFPFPPVSVVEKVDPTTGVHAPLISGLKTAIDVLALRSDDNENGDDDDNQTGDHHDEERGDTDYLVLQHASGPGPLITPPGLLLRFETPTGSPTIIANCLNRPTSMTLDKRTDTLYVTELLTGRIVAISVAP